MIIGPVLRAGKKPVAFLGPVVSDPNSTARLQPNVDICLVQETAPVSEGCSSSHESTYPPPDLLYLQF